MKPRRCIYLLAVIACFATVLPRLAAATLNWDTVCGDAATITGGGTWDTSNTTWNICTANTAWVNSNKDLAVFSGTAGKVTLGGDFTSSGITFSSAYTIAGGGFTLTLDNGDNPAVNSKNVAVTISANLASSGAVSISGNSNLSITGNNAGLASIVSIGGVNTVTLDSANALGSAAVTIATGNQPALGFGSAFTMNNAVTLGAGSSLWTMGSNTPIFGNNLTLAGNTGGGAIGDNHDFDGVSNSVE
jgi:fibronectin-binding autotransporter adhesin